MDVSEYRQAASLDRRVRTILSAFRAVVAHMGAHGRISDDSASYLTDRIGAIGRGTLAPAYFDGIDLELQVLDELLLHAARPESFSISGSPIRLTARAAALMSLVIHELASNAVKYGALSQPQAKIGVAWMIDYRPGVRILRFEWREAGVRMTTAARSAPGFGSALIERLIARELKGDGKMHFSADGVHCTIEFPWTDPGHGDE
jgi:two-component system CheB/CheR fusion protein